MTCKSGAKRGGARQRGFLRRFGFVYKTKDPVESCTHLRYRRPGSGLDQQRGASALLAAPQQQVRAFGVV